MQKIAFLTLIVFVAIIFVRNSDTLRTKNLISLQQQLKISIIFAIWIIVGALFCAKSIKLASFLIFFPLFLLFLAPATLKFWRNQQLEREIPVYINEIIMHIQSGEAFWPATKHSANSLTAFAQVKLNAGVERVRLAKGSLIVAAESEPRRHQLLISEFLAIATHQHQAVMRLKLLRERFATEDNFKKQVARATAMVRAQVMILTGLYILLGSVVLGLRGWHETRGYLLTSFTLFSLGLAFTIYLGRRFAWKV